MWHSADSGGWLTNGGSWSSTNIIKIEKQKFHFKVVVADCESDGLLGLEFLEKYGDCINLKSSTLTFDGRALLTHSKDKNVCYRVAVKETVTVPAGHRMIINASPQGRTSEWTWLVEPLSKVLKETLAVAKSLVNGEWDTIRIEVMNPSSQDVILYHGMHVAKIQPVSLGDDMQPI